MTTIKDVAEYAGVSITTVSHVLNKTRYVSPELVARVQEAVEVLGYRPNVLARSLRRKETTTLGMITPDNSNPFFAEVARSIEDVCFGLGYSVILCNSDQDEEKESLYIDVLMEKQVDGIVFVAAGGRAESLQRILDRNVPVVVIDRELQGVQCDYVLTDNREGGRQATGHLIRRGCRRIFCVAGPSDLTPSWERVNGYREALETAGLTYDPDLVWRGDFREASGYAAMQEMLDRSEFPCGVLVCNDMMAIGAISAISQRGLRMPEDVAVVGFDDIALASFTNPPLTTVAQPIQEMGQLAVEMLVQRINDKDLPFQRHLLDVSLVIRRTA